MNKRWFNGKTDRLQISDDFFMTPFAQGFHDSYQLNFWDNPFDHSEETWWNEYTLGFVLAKNEDKKSKNFIVIYFKENKHESKSVSRSY